MESQVKFIRHRLFVPRVKCKDIEELNQWLSDRCLTLAAGHTHPEFRDRTVAEYFAQEQPHLMAVNSSFEGYRETPARVSSTSLVSYDSNRYSVHASGAGKTAMIRAYADRLVIVHEDIVVGEHRRQFTWDKVVYDPWHYLPVLERKPGALRNCAPFKGWELPQPLMEVRTILSRKTDGDRQFVDILVAISVYGIEEVVQACAAGLAGGTVSRDVILNILSRTQDDPKVLECETPTHLPDLAVPPLADCGRYDELLVGDVHATE